jgi:type II secretory pathway component PulF
VSAAALRELGVLLQLGVPLPEALEAVTPAGEPAWQKLTSHVRAGSTLGQALERVGPPFPPSLAGCSEAHLAELAQTLAEEERSRMALAHTVQYPRWLAVGTLVLLWVLGGLLHFSFWPLVEGLGTMLPSLTVTVYRLLGPFLALATFVLGSIAVAPVSLLWYSGWSRNLEAACWLRWVDTLTACGTPLPRALELAGQPELATAVTRGDRLADALGKKRGQERLTWLVDRAEQAGFPRGALRRVGDILTREMELSLERHLQMLEPVAIALLAGLIALVIVVGFLPIYQLIGNLG